MGDFCRQLHDALGNRVEFYFGTFIESYRDEGDMIDVRFSDGGTGSFDLLVGADGQFSRTRRMMVGWNMLLVYFTVPLPIQTEEKYIATLYMAYGVRGVMIRRHDRNYMRVYLGGKVGVDEYQVLGDKDVEKEKVAFARMFKDAGWKVQSSPLLMSMAFIVSVWLSSRLIIGLRPFMGQVQDGVGQNDGKWDGVTSTQIGVFLQNCMMGLASLMRINIADYMMKENVKNWSLPYHERLVCLNTASDDTR
ncbi:hypothetical protein VI817_004195 [Penicillium citrinum]|nr:hypothetical protein VI817_004195 [Penicillium citrinum]